MPLKDIEIDDVNVRHHEPEKDLEELADSIKRHGQLQPVVLRGEYGKPPYPYKLMIGQRRYLAIRNILRKPTILGVFAGKITDEEAKIRSLVENMVRTELSYEDTADAITSLYKDFKRNDRKVAEHTGLALRTVRQFIYIEERASEKTKQRLRKKQVQPADVQRALRAASDDIDKADELLDLMKERKLPPPAKKRMIEYGQENPRASARAIIEHAEPPAIERAFLVTLPDKVRRALSKASEKLRMSPDEVAARAVEEWLLDKGFVE